LPQYLWPEASNAAIYILNQTPTKSLAWKTPYKALYLKLEYKPSYMHEQLDLKNLKVYGCKTYVQIIHIPRLQKLKPRALIGYLVGYVAYNIWRI
jgi:hypothetical protein